MGDIDSVELISYSNFAERCLKHRRYVRDAECEHFLHAVAQSAKSRELEIPQGQLLYRAQVGCAAVDTVEVDEDGIPYSEDIAFSAARMMPLQSGAREGRANSKGIPVLYAASDEETAIAEVAPHVGARVTVARLEVTERLKLIDCSVHHAAHPIALVFREADGVTEDTVWMGIDQAFSKPVRATDTAADYAPTQILAEQFLEAGFDGLRFKSSVGPGMNLALFSPGACRAVSASVVRVTSVTYAFKAHAGDMSYEETHD